MASTTLCLNADKSLTIFKIPLQNSFSIFRPSSLSPLFESLRISINYFAMFGVNFAKGSFCWNSLSKIWNFAGGLTISTSQSSPHFISPFFWHKKQWSPSCWAGPFFCRAVYFPLRTQKGEFCKIYHLSRSDDF